MVVVLESVMGAEGPVCCIALDLMVLASHMEAVDHNEVVVRTAAVVDRTAADSEAGRVTAQKDRVRMKSRQVDLEEDTENAIERRIAAVPDIAGTRVRPSEPEFSSKM